MEAMLGDDKFVERDFCNLRVSHYQAEINDVKAHLLKNEGKIDELSKCLQNKFNTTNRWLFTIMGALILNLILLLIKGII